MIRSTRLKPLHGALLVVAGLSGCAQVDTVTEPVTAPVTHVEQTTPAVPEAAPERARTRRVEVTARIEAGSLPDGLEVPPPEADLMDRIRSGLSLPLVENSRVQTHLSWYRRHPEYFDRVFSRGNRYLFHIVGELEARGMPVDLALLPIVESAFDPFAYSHGRASGLWQFIPGTGRRFGLKQDWWYDGRRDVLDSTRAALDYLEVLSDHFDGDWLLAVAAYNSGEGNVLRAIRRNKKAGKPTDFWNLKLPRETQAYVPQLLALRALVADPAAFGMTLPVLPDRPYFKVVPLDGQIDLALAADLAEVDIDALYHLNPGYNRWATDPAGPHRLLVPADRADAFAARLATLPDDQKVRWARHRIKPGESLIAIAAKYETTPAVIRQVNGVSGNTIVAGQWLTIPTATRDLDRYSGSADSRLAQIQQRNQDRKRIDYRVRSGDSFWTIARKHRVSYKALAKWNGMAPGDTLRIGRKLVIWKGGEVPTGAVPAVTVVQASTPMSRAAPAERRRVNYTVRNGDSLWTISRKFRVTVGDLKEWNTSLGGQKYLRPGQRLVMYVDVMAQSGG
jgi:membrane-bound lytic murein transglycosylase D